MFPRARAIVVLDSAESLIEIYNTEEKTGCLL